MCSPSARIAGRGQASAVHSLCTAVGQWPSRHRPDGYADAHSHPLDHAQRAVDVLADLGHKSAVRLGDRIGRVRASLIVAVQAGIAAGIVWYLAHDVIGHAAPFVGQAADAYRASLGFSGDVVVAQERSIATDLLRATGLDDSMSIRAVRRAVGRLTA